MKIPNYPSIQQFQAFVELKDFRPPTKKEYVRYVRKLAEHFQCDPATLTEDQLREYFLFLREHKPYKSSPMKAAKGSLRCFFRDGLKLGPNWTVFEEVRIVENKTLPVVLGRQEIAAVLATLHCNSSESSQAARIFWEGETLSNPDTSGNSTARRLPVRGTQTGSLALPTSGCGFAALREMRFKTCLRLIYHCGLPACAGHGRQARR